MRKRESRYETFWELFLLNYRNKILRMCIDCTQLICLLALLALVAVFYFRKTFSFITPEQFSLMSWTLAYVSIALLFMGFLTRRTALEPILRQHPVWFIKSTYRCMMLWRNDQLPPGQCLNEPD